MSDIPEARKRLDDVILFADLDDATRAELRAIRDLLGRARPVTKTPVTSVKLTPSVKDEILRLKRANPDMSEQRIATLVNTNAGRVSETLSGKRGARWRL